MKMIKVLCLLLLVFITLQKAQSCTPGTQTLLSTENGFIEEECRDKNICRLNCDYFFPNCKESANFEIIFTRNYEEAKAYLYVCLNNHYRRAKNTTQEQESFFSQSVKKMIRNVDPSVELPAKEINFHALKVATRGARNRRVLLALIRHARLLQTFGQLCTMNKYWKVTFRKQINDLQNYNLGNLPSDTAPKDSLSRQEIGEFLSKQLDRMESPDFKPFDLQIIFKKDFLVTTYRKLIEPHPELVASFMKHRDLYTQDFIKHMLENGGKLKRKNDICKCKYFEKWVVERKERFNRRLRSTAPVRTLLRNFYPNLERDSLVPSQVASRAKKILLNSINEFEGKLKEAKPIKREFCRQQCENSTKRVNTPSSPQPKVNVPSSPQKSAPIKPTISRPTHSHQKVVSSKVPPKRKRVTSSKAPVKEQNQNKKPVKSTPQTSSDVDELFKKFDSEIDEFEKVFN